MFNKEKYGKNIFETYFVPIRLFGTNCLIVEAPDGKKFKCSMKHEWEQTILLSKFNFSLIREALRGGMLFVQVFKNPLAWGVAHCEESFPVPEDYIRYVQERV